MSILHDKRLRAVPWKDLTQMTTKDILIENLISLPWIVISLVLFYNGHYLLALPFSFIFFLTGLRQVHNGFHYTLGTSKKAVWWVLFLHSILMLASMQAVKYNHLRHHKYCLQKEDVEGMCAKMNAFQAILHGPLFIFRIHTTVLGSSNKKIIKNVWIELLAIGCFVFILFLFDIKFLYYHLTAMVAGEFLTGFFAVWTVHHDCDEHMFARTLSNKWKNMFTYNMFYHLEHHLFPKVPTIKLPELSKRIKEKLPDMVTKEVF